MPKFTILMVIAWFCFSVSSSFAAEPDSYEIRAYSKSFEIKSYEMKEPDTMEVSKPGFSEVSKPAFSKARKPEYLVPKQSAKGVTIWSGKRENKAYKRCAKLKGFDAQHKCALDALGMTEEDLN
jgi:hypothetical protein